jgi:hypothetical protein
VRYERIRLGPSRTRHRETTGYDEVTVPRVRSADLAEGVDAALRGEEEFDINRGEVPVKIEDEGPTWRDRLWRRWTRLIRRLREGSWPQ